MDPTTIELIQLYRAAGLDLPDDLITGMSPAEFEPAIREAIEETPVFYRAMPLQRASDDTDTEALTRTYIASAQAVDRAGDLVQIKASRKPIEYRGKQIKPEGMRTANFKAAGAPVLWAHNRKEDMPPVGRVIAFRASTVHDPAQNKQVPAMLETVQFTPHEDFPLSRTVAYLATVTKSLNTVSQGFVPEVTIWVEDAKEREKLGLGPWGAHFLQSDQIELSMTPTPMLPLAVGVEGKSWGDMIDADVARGMRQLVERGIITNSLHDEILPILVPVDGDARAAARVKGFVEFRSAMELGGSWPFQPEVYRALPEAEVEDEGAGDAESSTGTADGHEPAERSADSAEDADAPWREVVQRALGAGCDTPADAERMIGLAMRARDSEDAVGAIRRLLQTPEGGDVVEHARTVGSQWRSRGALLQSIADELKITGAAPTAFVDAIHALQARASSDADPGAVYAEDFVRMEEALEQVAAGENSLSRLLDELRSRGGVDLAQGRSTVMADRLARSIEGLTQLLRDRGESTDGGETPPRQVPRAARSDDDQGDEAIGAMLSEARSAMAAVDDLLGHQSPAGA